MRSDLGSKSIAEIEGNDWPHPGPQAAPTLVRCYELRKKPIATLTARDWRLLIGQDIGLELLMPVAMSAVEADPLVEVEHYRGDLLVAILRASPAYFAKRGDLRARVERVLDSLPLALEKLEVIDYDTTSEAVEEATAQFVSGDSGRLA